MIVTHPHATRILDDRSANGTFVNGRRVTGAQSLKRGDVIELGTSQLTFDIE